MKYPTQRARAILIALAVLSAFAPRSRAVPNIVLVMVDDVGTESFECYFGNPRSTHDTDGDPLIKTPNITALAESGIRYTRAFALPLCTPTRVELLSGKHSFRNYRAFGYMDNDQTTFAQVLRANGYTTAIAGKWQLSCPDYAGFSNPSGPIAPGITPAVMRDDYGFEQYLLWQLNITNCTGGREERYWDPQQETASPDGFASVLVPSTSADYGPARCVEFLETFISESAAEDQPFLAYYPVALPHNPFVATPDSSEGQGSNVGDKRFYDDNIEYIDTIVGQLVAHLEDPDGEPATDDSIRDNTLFIFTSDNGTNTGITVTNDSGTVTGEKGTASNYGTHVPLILSWPGTIAAAVSDRPVDFTDFFPTLLGVADIPSTGLELDGVSLLDDDGSPDTDKQVAYLWYDPKGRNWPTAQCALDSRFKLYADGRLYDLIADPSESNDLSNSPPPEAAAALPALQAVIELYADDDVAGPGYHGVATAVNYWDFDTLADGVPRDRASDVAMLAGGNLLLEDGSYGSSPRGGDYLKTTRGINGVPLSADVSESMNFGTGSFSFSYWSYNDTSDDGGDLRGARIFDCLASSAEGLHLSSNNTGVFNLRLDDDAGNSIRSSIDPVPPLNALMQPGDRWVQVTVVINRDPTVNRAEVFFDGASVGGYSIASLTGRIFPTHDLQIGCINGGTNAGGVQTGGLDDLAFYRGNLTAAQIAALAAGENPISIDPPSSSGPLRLDITAVSGGTELEFSWNSTVGVSYALLSSTTLQGPRDDWVVMADDIAATPPINRVTLERPASEQTFYVLRESGLGDP